MSASVTGKAVQIKCGFGDAPASASYPPLKALDRDARHSVHRMRKPRRKCEARRDRCPARDIRARSPRTSASGRNTGRTVGGTCGKQSFGRLQMPPRLADQLVDRRPRAPASACRKTPPRCRCRGFAGIAAAGTVAGAPHRAAARRSPARSRERSPAWRARCSISADGGADDPRGQRKQAPTRSRGHNLRAPPASASDRCRGRTDAPRSAATIGSTGRPKLRIARKQLGRDRIALDAAMASARQHVGPPLQADLAGQGLADLVADADDLDIEGIEREQRAALLRRHEQGRGIADEIVAAHEIGAKRRRVLAGSDRSWHRDQRGRDAAPLAHHDVVGADRRSRLHRVQHHMHRSQRGAQVRPAAPRPRCRCRRSACRCCWPRQRRAASEYLSICSGRVTSQAQIASGRHSSEPRCDMPAKAKPPLP